MQILEISPIADCPDDQLVRVQVKIAGIVQGVGFRPFVYRLAKTYRLAGFVRNSGGKLEIEAEGNSCDIKHFIEDLVAQAPPLAAVNNISIEYVFPTNAQKFSILQSADDKDSSLRVSVDSATCVDCLKELFDSKDKRFNYPFINCVNCGPRFTIIDRLPYDRHLTTMSDFQMCQDCLSEYRDPLNRRFHSQPNACSICGPQLTLARSNGKDLPFNGNNLSIIEATVQYLFKGNVVALKSLGGFQLMGDATNYLAVNNLRKRKIRPSKPFAVMMRDLNMVKKYCSITKEEERLLGSLQAPIVLLNKLFDSDIAENVAPNIHLLGVMLPYTPLHHLLISSFDRPLIMTSGNMSEEPIVIDNSYATKQLAGIADYFLIHDRRIAARYDDSVIRVANGYPVILRRARGYAPEPIELAYATKKPILSFGGQLKNTFCFYENNQAFVSPHIGDLVNIETMEHYENTIEKYSKLFELKEELLVCDVHPDYLSTKLAETLAIEKNIPLLKVQHHHAHIVSCMAEHNLLGPVIGIAFDGAGYGLDGSIWGGEFIIADLKTFTRYACLEPVRMPGGEQAIRDPWRMALAYINQKNYGSDFADFQQNIEKDMGFDKLNIILQQIQKGVNSPLTSSCGRLFDAISSILGICHRAFYEGQAAIELESIAMQVVKDTESLEKQISLNNSIYSYSIVENTSNQNYAAQYHVSIKNMFREIAQDKTYGKSVCSIAWQFHHTLVQIIVDVCILIREKYLIDKVCLSGGVFQNNLLLQAAELALQAQRFSVYFQQKVPANDGGISFGQAIIAAAQTNNLCGYL